MISWLLDGAFILYLAASVGLLIFGLNSYVMLRLYRRCARSIETRQRQVEAAWAAAHPVGEVAGLPIVTTQIPLYNELNVAERVIRAIAAFDYPKRLHQIQVLDDSTDETRELVDRVAQELQAAGVWIEVLRREDRVGYKAGALSDAMGTAAGEFIAIFDGDFVPAPDFLRSLLPHFADAGTALVQARWGHLNRDESLLTRAQAVGIDGHFMIEQAARSANRLFLNFNGTAGIWRRSAIKDAGGWTADTLTEDLDLSYRAQLRGWHLEYVPHVVAPAELPATYLAFKSQQFRWAKGSLQTAIKLLPEILRSERSWFTKFQCVLHLCAYGAHPLMLVVALLAWPVMHHLNGAIPTGWLIVFTVPLLASTLGPALLYAVSQRLLDPADWRARLWCLPGLMVVGFGICLSNTRAVGEAILGVQSGFIRTPKRGASQGKTYRAVVDYGPVLEIAAGLYAVATLIVYLRSGNYGVAPFLSLYAAGFSVVGWSSLREQIQAKRNG